MNFRLKGSALIILIGLVLSIPSISHAQGRNRDGEGGSTRPPTQEQVRQEVQAVQADRAAAATSTPTQTTDSGVHYTPVTPELSVPIPGLTFTTAYAEGDQLVVPYLAQYISAVYRYLLGISTIVAIIVVICGGFIYLLGQTTGSTKQGLTLIKDAIAGLIVLYCSYLILWTVNPNLVNLQPIRLDLIRSIPLGEGSGAFGDSYEDTGDTSQCRMRYNQGRDAWAAIPYGASAALMTNGTDTRSACRSAAESNTTSCIGTFQQSGCGPTAVASVLRFYGLQVAVPNRVPAPGNAMHLIDPIDTGILAVLKGYRIIASGTTGEIARSVRQNFPQFTSRTIETSNTAAILNALNSGHPLVFSARQQGIHLFSDDQATQPMHQGAPMYTGGHYMVLSGVVSNDILRVHDVGNGLTKTIRMAELQANGGGIVEIKPKSSYQETMTATWGTVQVQMNLPAAAASGGQCTAGPSHASSRTSAAPAGAIPGTVVPLSWSYLPESQSVENWPANSARILYPQRLAGVRGAPVHVFIYIHGNNNHNTPTDASHYLPLLNSSLAQVAGGKNIVIFTPHHNGGAGNNYPGFDLGDFYDKALIQLRTVIPEAVVVDTVVGGHSGATCSGGPVLRQALSATLHRLRGIIAYDGCTGSTLTPSNFTPSGDTALYINADLVGSGMGDDMISSGSRGTIARNLKIRSEWHMSVQTCPPCAQNAGQTVTCYGKNAELHGTNGAEEILFETGADHGPSVGLMTKIAFCAFYQNSTPAAR